MSSSIEPPADARTAPAASPHGEQPEPQPSGTRRPAPGDLPAGRPPQTQFDDSLNYPRIGGISFRRGTLTENQAALWNDRFDELGTVLTSDSGLLDDDSWFGRTGHPTVVEIGSGTGTSTVAMAAKEPDTNVIAVELYKPGLAKMLGALTRAGLDNIRFVRGDGVEVLSRMIAPGSLTGVRVFFPDPWPKARHHKRRIIQSGTLHLIATRLRPGGVLHVATDHAGYAAWISELAEVEPLLRYRGWPWVDAPILTDRQVITKFEGRGHRLDHDIHEFLWERIENPAGSTESAATGEH